MSLWLLALLPVDALPSRPPEDGADGVVMDALRYRQHLPNVVGGDGSPPTADLLSDDPGLVQPARIVALELVQAEIPPGEGLVKGELDSVQCFTLPLCLPERGWPLSRFSCLPPVPLLGGL